MNVLESVGVINWFHCFVLYPSLIVAADKVAAESVHISNYQVLTRRAKNKYNWKGLGAIPKALQELKVLYSDKKTMIYAISL